jgi:hypothetical protein
MKWHATAELSQLPRRHVQLSDRVNPSPVNVERQEFAVPAAHHEIQGLQYLADFRWPKRPFGSRLIDASGYRQFMINVRSNLRHNDLLAGADLSVSCLEDNGSGSGVTRKTYLDIKNRSVAEMFRGGN